MIDDVKFKSVMNIYEQQFAKFDIINQTILNGDSDVQQFYDGAVIFLTGGSGFLGKQLIEKLFRSCKIKKIYLLLRAQQNTSGLERIQKTLEDPLYEYLFKTQPDFPTKIIPVNGDMTKIHLGIDAKIWRELANEINIIFHSAATINFTEPLKIAALTNVRGTQEVLNFARDCKNLRSIVHVSTAYVQSTVKTAKQTIMEQFYKSPLSPEFLLQLVEELDDESLETMTPQLLQHWPNTYAFTKAIAEELVRKSSDGLPICIVRPAIVVGAMREPPGWIDKKTALNGPVGFIMGACLGAIHVAYAEKDTISDMVPVDFVNNAIMIAARETAKRHQSGERDIKIYTASTNRNSFSFDDINKFIDTEMRPMAPRHILWYPYLILTNSKLLFTLLSYLLHFVPGYLADAVLRLSGQKPRAIRLLTKAFKQNRVYGVYMTNDWKFDDQNLATMYQRLSPADQIMFNCDFTCAPVIEGFITSIFGGSKYILKEDVKIDKLAMFKQHVLRVVNIIYIIGYIFVLWTISSKIFLYLYGVLTVVKNEVICK